MRLRAPLDSLCPAAAACVQSDPQPLLAVTHHTTRRGQTGWFYFLHYNGWNKKYDEWVEEAGLVKAEVAEASGAVVGFRAHFLLSSSCDVGMAWGLRVQPLSTHAACVSTSPYPCPSCAPSCM